MKQTYTVFHPVNGEMNHECVYGFAYEPVYAMEAHNLEQVWTAAQNDFNEDYASKGIRSTCVGDIIQSTAATAQGICFIIRGHDFKHVPASWLEVKKKVTPLVVEYKPERLTPVMLINLLRMWEMDAREEKGLLNKEDQKLYQQGLEFMAEHYEINARYWKQELERARDEHYMDSALDADQS